MYDDRETLVKREERQYFENIYQNYIRFEVVCIGEIAMNGPFNKPVVCPVVIGRAPDLAALSVLMERTKSGEGQMVLLCGEAGIGKSRLVAEVKASAQGFLSLQGNCFSSDITCPYAPFLDLFANLPTTIAAQSSPFPRELLPLLPEREALLSVAVDLPVLPKVEPEQEKRRLFSALARFFLSLATEDPLLLIVEDLHWCDDISLEFLHYLARRCVALPFCLLLTYRNDEVRPRLKRWLAQLDRERLAQEMLLARLTYNDVDGMLHAMLNLPPTFQRDLLDTVYALTEGNPFFVEELLKSLILTSGFFSTIGSWGFKQLSELHIPRSVQDAVQRRSEHLSEAARHVLLLASVIGRRFDFVFLQQLIGEDERQLLIYLKELISAQLIIEESADQFVFRHALTRQAIYAELLVRERRMLHGTIAQMMESFYAARQDVYLADISMHFYEAEMWPKALEYALRAGERAQRLHAPRATIEYLTRALLALQSLGREPSIQLYRERGQAYETLGKFDQARTDYEQALALARATHKVYEEWQSLMNLGFLWSERDYARGGSYYQQAMDQARTMDNPVTMARSLNRIGNWHLNLEQAREALQCHQEALAIFQRVREPYGLAETLDLLGMASYLGGDQAQSMAYYEQAVEHFRTLKQSQGLISCKATLMMCGGNYQTETLIPVAMSTSRIILEGEQAVALAREIGQRSGEAYALMNMGFSLGPRGEYTRALECAQAGLAIAEEIEHRQWMTGIHCALGAIYRDLLAFAEARQHLERAIALAQETGSHFWLNIAVGSLTSACIGVGDLARAQQLLDETLDAHMPMQTIGQRILWYASAELALARQEPQQALRILDALIASAPGTAAKTNSLPYILRLRGEAYLSLNTMIDAEEALQAGLKAADEQGMRSVMWRLYLKLGNLYRRQRRNEESGKTFGTAQEAIDELAANIQDEALRSVFVSQTRTMFSATRPLSARRAAKEASGGLTERERNVALLIAQGKYNREIADELVISERTVETHISNIMYKLSVASRRQIARWTVEKGLLAHE